MSVFLKLLSGKAGAFGGVFLLGLAIGGFWRSGKTAEARARADVYSQRAESLASVVHADSATLALSRASYDSLVVHVGQAMDSVKAAAEKTKKVVVVTRTHTDSVLVGADSAIIAAVQAERDAAAEQLSQVETERDQYKILFQRADSGWAAEITAHQRTRDALNASLLASAAWKRAAEGTVGQKAVAAIPAIISTGLAVDLSINPDGKRSKGERVGIALTSAVQLVSLFR